ncbi:MAG: hypothetical protein U1F43_30655 [Myxococcota bacterium]
MRLLGLTPLGIIIALLAPACDDPGSAAAESDVTADDTMAAPDTVSNLPDVPPAAVGLPLLGAGSHSPEGLVVETLLDASQGLGVPRDLAFNPNVRDDIAELWVADADMTMFIVTDPATPSMHVKKAQSLGSDHFMPTPVGLAFGDAGTMATVHETDWVTQSSTPADFMGPTLWPSDSSAFNGGWKSHLDMLHDSPDAVGIAWDHGNAFWVFDGFHESITYYDFVHDHGPGGEDHSDGVIVRWVEGEVAYLPGVTSDMALDHSDGALYIADTGNARIAVLDTASGTPGGVIGPNYDDASMHARKDGVLVTLIDMAALGASQPTGLVLRDRTLWVSDRSTSRVYAFEVDDPTDPIDWLDLSSVVPAGQLGAIELDHEGRLLVLDVEGARVLRLSLAADAATATGH